MPRRVTLFCHEHFGWPNTCPRDEAAIDEDTAGFTIYTFIHTNQHSGERFEVLIRQAEYGRERLCITVELL